MLHISAFAWNGIVGLNPATIREALARLSAEQREILILRDFNDLGYAEIAQVLEVPHGTVMSRLHRARLALRKEMTHDTI
jgi:RNA polymerase sigma-70 factor (ECF subfamily)